MIRTVRIHCIGILVFGLCGCGGKPLPPPSPSLDDEYDLANTTAEFHVERGEMNEAAQSFARALDRARILDNPQAISATAFNLAICDAELADYVDATALLHEAHRETVRVGGNTADIDLAQARVTLASGDLQTAKQQAQELLARSNPPVSVDQRLSALLVVGSVDRKTENLAAALSDLEQANAAAQNADDKSALAALSGLNAKVRLWQQQYLEAAQDFDQQAQICQSIRQFRQMDQALADAGRAYIAAGKLDEAADRLYRSARAAFAHGDANAGALKAEALAAARSIKDADLVLLISALKTSSAAATMPSVP